MDVKWTWGLACKLAAALCLSSLAAFGAGRISLELGLGPDLATIVSIGVWLGNFFLLDRSEK